MTHFVQDTNPDLFRNNPDTDTAKLMLNPYDVFDAQDAAMNDPTQEIKKVDIAMGHLDRLTGLARRSAKATVVGGLVLGLTVAGFVNKERLAEIEWPPFNPQISKLLPDMLMPDGFMPTTGEVHDITPARTPAPTHRAPMPTPTTEPHPNYTHTVPPGIIVEPPLPKHTSPDHQPELAPPPYSVEPVPEVEEPEPAPVPAPEPEEEQPTEIPPTTEEEQPTQPPPTQEEEPTQPPVTETPPSPPVTSEPAPETITLSDTPPPPVPPTPDASTTTQP